MDAGPGHELEILFLQMGVPYREDCGCRAYARQMDAWGVHGCQEHIEEIVQRLRENAQKYLLMERLATALTAVSSGLAFRLNPLDPFPGIVAEAIRRAGDRRQDGSNTNSNTNLRSSE